MTCTDELIPRLIVIAPKGWLAPSEVYSGPSLSLDGFMPTFAAFRPNKHMVFYPAPCLAERPSDCGVRRLHMFPCALRQASAVGAAWVRKRPVVLRGGFMKKLPGHFFEIQVLRWSFMVLSKIGCFLVSWESWANHPDWMAARNAKPICKKRNL
jgi:hypothetical protein